MKMGGGGGGAEGGRSLPASAVQRGQTSFPGAEREEFKSLWSNSPNLLA